MTTPRSNPNNGHAKQSREQHPASFRDPSGFLFSRGGLLYRQINRAYENEYARLMDSGLYERLVKAGMLIPHVEVEQEPASERTSGLRESEAAFKVIQPERVPFLSYPYEWSFGQLKSAALTTLSIQKRALKAGMTLKDASAYNIQFVRGKPTLIDTLSFAIYNEGEPWVAYRQFCQHFLAPLALMAWRDVRLNQLLRVYIDGVPLDLASRLLPARTRFHFGLLTHIHLHAGAQKRYAGEAVKARGSMSRQALTGLIESLEAAIQKLAWTPRGTEWGNYYDITNYSDAAFEHKKGLVGEWSNRIQPALVWDLGANNGAFSRVAGETGAFVVSFDVDPAAVEQNYQTSKKANEQNILPLLLDLTNPSPAIGWANREREAFAARGPADLTLALALIHHLAISNNVPLPQLADFFAETGKRLIIEFVPKTDSQAQKLLAARLDIFPAYTREGFEAAFQAKFTIHAAVEIRDSERVLYLMERR